MQQLTGLDAAFLAMETPSARLNQLPRCPALAGWGAAASLGASVGGIGPRGRATGGRAAAGAARRPGTG